jgi:glycine dehydrogenase subunit 1
MEFVGLPVYSWGAAVGHAMRMAARITDRNVVLVPEFLDSERLAIARTYAGSPELSGHLELVSVRQSRETGRLEIEDLQEKLSADVAAIYFENPSYLGIIEDAAEDITAAARRAGAITIAGVDPMSLGVIAPPGEFGADIAVGSTQPLGVHMPGGGGVGGFIATRDEERFAREYPTLQVSITDTIVEGERGFGLILFEQSSYGSREKANDWTGNSVYLWAIANAAYMSMMGPQGFRDLGKTIIQRSHFAAREISSVDGVSVRWPEGFFKEFVVSFDGTGRTVEEINRGLLDHGIFGGKDLSEAFPELGQSALYCVTEIHSAADIRLLTSALREVTS